MDQRRIGNSSLAIAPLALGGNVFGWTADEAASFALLDAFVDAGGSMIDSADIYSAWAPGNQGGESESVIGRWLKRDPAKRDKVVIATKVGLMAGLKPETITAACDASLARLGVDTIDLYYQHKDDESVPLADSLEAFDALVGAGKVREIRAVAVRAGPAARGDGGERSQWPSPAVRAADLVQSRRARQARRSAAQRGGRVRARHSPLFQPRQRLPHRQIPVEGGPREIGARAAQRRLSRGTRGESAKRWTRSPRRLAQRLPASPSPGPWSSRGSSRRSPARRASASSTKSSPR